jgi:hypothetical protein
MSAISVVSREDAPFVGVQVSLMLTTARSALNWRKIEMDALK